VHASAVVQSLYLDKNIQLTGAHRVKNNKIKPSYLHRKIEKINAVGKKQVYVLNHKVDPNLQVAGDLCLTLTCMHEGKQRHYELWIDSKTASSLLAGRKKTRKIDMTCLNANPLSGDGNVMRVALKENGIILACDQKEYQQDGHAYDVLLTKHPDGTVSAQLSDSLDKFK
jgi:hypothetical protein